MSFNVSEKLSRVAPSATMAVTQSARNMLAAGIDVIGLGAGESDFDTPDHIKDAGVKAIKDGKTNYTNVDGIPELKEAIINKYKRDNNLVYSSSQINVSPGGKPVIYNALMATLNDGDEVIIPAPCWVSYPEMVKMCGGKPKVITCDISDNFKLTPEKLEEHITSKTKWLILNSPSNPTGAAYTSSELECLADVLIRYPQIMILTDDIYEHLIYNNFKFHTIAQVEPALYERTLTMNGLSKAYAMTGWRIGYAGGPEWLIKAMGKVMSQSTSNACSISQWAGVAALNGSQDFIYERNKKFVERRDMVVSRLNRIEGIVCNNPDGAFYVYPDCSGLIGKITPTGTQVKNDIDFSKLLLEISHVAVVPGGAFHSLSNFRISYATSMEKLSIAMNRISKFCEALK
jgi:aspartate aminotransferase